MSDNDYHKKALDWVNGHIKSCEEETKKYDRHNGLPGLPCLVLGIKNLEKLQFYLNEINSLREVRQ